MFRILTQDENLENLRERLSKNQDRPVYICSGLFRHGTHYALPGADKHVSLGNLEAYLSRWTDDGLCVKREGEDYHYNLSPSRILKLVYPLKRSELKARGYGSGDFESIGVESAGRTTVRLSKGETLFPELEQYVEAHKPTRARGIPEGRGITFAVSGDFLAPEELRPDWHLGFSTETLTSLQGPGRYPTDQYPLSFANDNNGVGISDRDPGGCVVCRGAKGCRKHFGVIAFAPGAYLTNLVCEGCAEQTFNSWLTLLKNG